MSAAIPANLLPIMQRAQSQLVFDAKLADQLKEIGINTAAQNRAEILALARTLAIYLAMRDPNHEMYADKVQAALAELGYTPADLGNAAGGLFRGAHWQFTGRRRKSERPEGHSNEQRIWKLIYATGAGACQ